ncbi:MAG: NAD(+) diphosphatase [Azoarcus sp.]|jgi:NAD+ diphosphatase|nr:NAD(+) diphosphatase [Azoarcus sp.]
MIAAAPDFEPAYGSIADPSVADERTLVFPFVGQTLLIGPDAALPRQPMPQSLGNPLRALRFGVLAGRDCVLRVWPAGLAIPPDLSAGDYRSLWGQWPPGYLAAFVRARQLAAWILHNRFCGACGQAMETGRAEIACECPACGYKAYPRISPVAIGIVLKGDEILLARSPHFAPGMYSALAGFVEAGESAEACLRREVREEAGIEIRNIRYFDSQSWPYPHSLMLGFIADYHGGDLVAQEGEIEDIGWFRLDGLPILPHAGSLARRMIDAVCRTLAKKTRRP